MSGNDIDIKLTNDTEAGFSDKLMEEAKAHADKQLEKLKAEDMKRKAALIKFGAMAAVTAILGLFALISWMTMGS